MWYAGCVILGLLIGCALTWVRESVYWDTLNAARTTAKDLAERNDRLVEAIARKGGVEIAMPQPELPREKSEGWWDLKHFYEEQNT